MKARPSVTKSKAQYKYKLSIFWPIIGVVGVLFLVVTSILTLSMGQNESSMVRLLIGEGAALIHAVEGSVRINMRQRSPAQLHATLKELINVDVRFVSIVLPDGTILAHSNAQRIGSILQVDGNDAYEDFLEKMSKKVENSSLRWFIAEVDGKETFVIYREFMPKKISRRRKNTDEPPFYIAPPDKRHPPRNFSPPATLIFLGLDITPFEVGQKQDRIYLFSLAGGVVLLGVALLLALYYALHAQESRRRQNLAEGQVRLLEEEMRRKEKLAAIGNLAAGVAHEIRNPLSSIKGYATYFGQRFPEGSEDRQAAGVMVREVERLNRVITDLIGLSRPTDVHAVPSDILPVLDHSLHLLRQDAEKKGVSLDIRRPKRPLPKVFLDVDRFGQALLNICLNALEAMPQGGLLQIIPYVYNQYFMALEIKDTGMGIQQSHLPHIFDPYFTTKGQGTGLGLAMVHKIIEAHGGEISVHSKQAHMQESQLTIGQETGTVFRILLPIVKEKEGI